jgi:signal transduction histidine kinase/ActR/RegA family two-component response regulator
VNEFFRLVRVHRASAVVVLVGVIASFGAFWASSASVHDNNGQLLRGDAAQASLVFAGELGAITGPFQGIGKVVTPFGVSQTAFAAASESAVKAKGSVALVRVTGNTLTVVASVGNIHRDFQNAADDASIIAMASRSATSFPGMATVSQNRWLEELFAGKGYSLPPGFLLYAELSLGKGPLIYKLPGLLFPGTTAYAYVGSVSPGNVILQTSERAPSDTQQAISTVDSSSATFAPNAVLTSDPDLFRSSGNLIVAMSADSNLTGRFAANFPWILLVGGVAAVLILAWLLGVATVRRERALGYVDELEVKNTELDEALSRQAQAEQRLRQAQRMEAVGQLAGGIAHDFNNLLQAIISYSEFLSEGVEPGSEMQRDVAEVQKAANRAAELTRQLLVYSRQDVTQPEVIDLNNVVRDAERLLRHTIGEDVRLSCQFSSTSCCVLADTGELELMLMNLAINARDAMPRGGNLGITVDAVTLDGRDAESAGLVPGSYARLSVSDNGEGMAPEVAARAFEPFFTTKETGRGTGMGLAMVYGITVRWGGSTSISTVPGLGTTISLLLPLSDESPKAPEPEKPKVRPRGDRDVALLVEDQEGVRRSTARILEAAGYEVLQAENGVEAMAAHPVDEFDILVTDLVMPGGITGKQLADEFHAHRPDLPVVFISGYSAEVISEREILPPTTHLVRKPFTPEDLLQAVSFAVEQKRTVPQ